MKKIYALVGVAFLGSAALAQHAVPFKSNKSVVHAGEKYSHQIKDAKTPVKDNGERLSGYFTEDFEMGFTGNNAGTEPSTGMWTHSIVPGNNVMVDWEITNVGHANDAGSTFNIPALLSTSGLGVNGQWAMVDSDSDGAGGSSEECYLVSPEIDLSGVTNNALALEWQQFFAEWTNPTDDTIRISVSTDGSNWTTLSSIDDGVGRDNRPNPEVVRVDLTSLNLAGESTVWFRFDWKGEWNYGWQIDDIELVDLPPHNLVLNTSWATHNAINQAGNVDKISYTKIPTDQVFDIEISGNVSNLGANTQTAVVLSATSGAFAGTSPVVGTLNPGEDSTLTVSSMFNPGAGVASHTITYDVAYANVAMEDNAAGLTGSYTFDVTASEYSRDRDDYNGQGLWNGDDGSGTTNAYVMGNAFQIEANATLEGVSAVMTASTDVGAIIYAVVYSVDVQTGDFTPVNQSVDVEVKSYHIPASNGPGAPEMWFPLQANLVAGNTYIVCIGHYGGPDAAVIANSTTATSSANTTFLLDGTDNTWYYLTSVPMVRAHFAIPGWVGVEDVTSNGITLGQNQPNPFNGNTQITYSIENGANVTLEVVDVTGKVVATYNEGTKASGTYTVDVNSSELAAGMYSYTLTANGNRLTKRMMVTK